MARGDQPIVRRRTAQMDATSPMSPNVRSLGPSVGIDVSWSGTTTTAAFTTANTTSVNSNVSRPTCATNQKGASRCNNRSISERDCRKTNGRFKKRLPGNGRDVGAWRSLNVRQTEEEVGGWMRTENWYVLFLYGHMLRAISTLHITIPSDGKTTKKQREETTNRGHVHALMV